jgi:hypothetical protein
VLASSSTEDRIGTFFSDKMEDWRNHGDSVLVLACLADEALDHKTIGVYLTDMDMIIICYVCINEVVQLHTPT